MAIGFDVLELQCPDPHQKEKQHNNECIHINVHWYLQNLISAIKCPKADEQVLKGGVYLIYITI